jgi:hypothetical protein
MHPEWPDISTEISMGQEQICLPRRMGRETHVVFTIPHTFWNVGPAPARLIEIITPSKFEHFFHELDALAATTGPDEFPDRRAELGARYDQDFVDGWAEELKQRFGLKLLGE